MAIKRTDTVGIVVISFAIMLIGAGCSSQESGASAPAGTNFKKYKVDTDAMEIDPSDTFEETE